MTSITRQFLSQSLRLPKLQHSLAIIAAAGLLSACSDSHDSTPPPPTPEVVVAPAPFAEILEQGINRYLGVYTPMTSEVDGDVVNHTFSASDGPMCMRGGEFSMATRDQGSEDLVIFLQGGGGCFPGLCEATETAHLGIPKLGILDPELAGNPVASWNTVYLPYCDGGLHASDADVDSDDDGDIDRFHHGLHNLSASLDVAVNTFPSPRRILLTGISGGGFGTPFALPLVRSLYPDVPIELINDSGVGIGKPDQPEFQEELFAYWNATAFIPESCADCIGDDGHSTNYYKWQLEEDENLRLGMMSYKQDFVIGTFFVGIGGPAFEAALIPEMEDLEAAHPDRVRSFIADGNSHTFLLSDFNQSAGGVTVVDWVSAMLDGSDDWVSVID